MTRAKDAILEDLAREGQRLAALERTREEARTRIEWLRSELATASAPTPLLPLATNGKAPHTPADKVKLFRSLFRGRPTAAPEEYVRQVLAAVDEFERFHRDKHLATARRIATPEQRKALQAATRSADLSPGEAR